MKTSEKKRISKENVFDGDHETPTHRAAAEGDTQLLVVAIKQDPSSIQQKDSDGYTPLHHTVLGKHMSALKRLVKMGADVNAQDGQGRTCLSIAAYQGWCEGLIYLLRKGARQDIVDNSGRSPLHASTYDTDVKPLTTLLKRLKSEGINLGDNEKMTTLHWAAFHDRPDHVRQLLQKGALLTVADVDGKTPLHWAAQNGSRACAVLLVESDESGELLSRVDKCGKLALHLAAAAGHVGILQDLAEAGPHLCGEGDMDDRTPLHWSAATGHASCVRTLLNLGVSPDPRDADGVTPLEYSNNAGHLDCKTLIQNKIKSKGTKPEVLKRKSGGGGSSFLSSLFSRRKHEKASKKSSETTALPDVVSTSMVHARDVNGHKSNCMTSLKPDADIGAQSQTFYNKSFDFGDVNSDVHAKNINARLKKTTSHQLLNANGEFSPSSPSLKTPTTLSKNKEPVTNGNYGLTPHTRGIHLSPLGDFRAHSLSPRVYSPGLLRESPGGVLRRAGELEPLRKDRPMKEKRDFPLPLPSHLTRLRQDFADGRSRSPTPTVPYKISGRVVLPDIKADLAEGGLDTDTRINRKEKKKKHRKKEQRPEVVDETPSYLGTPVN
ncbi:ankyrin repeat domain-containing protein 55-like [Dreissena polymorpha]|uniref:Ankyrin repeat domain-containing protein 55 n=1 Tax=Dreissena polymorpha TaxID=45954 RepID=A0A9D4BSN9_DREPO|nr:ankyrin repeat domain-containing protein 55-like [Dreissena polymorpha]KAH3707840.1 hypothetical protein DPMN_067257 [Dreissena polymorpha]